MVHSWSSLGLLLHYLYLPLVYLHQARVKKTCRVEWDGCVVVGPAWSLETTVWHQIQNKILDREDLLLTPRHWPELLELLPNVKKSRAGSFYFPLSRWSASHLTAFEAIMTANLNRRVEYCILSSYVDEENEPMNLEIDAHVCFVACRKCSVVSLPVMPLNSSSNATGKFIQSEQAGTQNIWHSVITVLTEIQILMFKI